jgi:anti-sigma factor RsiW
LVTCKDFLSELGEFLDDATDPQTRKELEQHITECPNCWVVFDTTKKTIQVFKGMDPDPLPEPMHNRLVQALEKKAKDRTPARTAPQA